MQALIDFENWIADVVTESLGVTVTNHILNEAKGHLDHPEDLVFTADQRGVLHAIDVIQKTAANPAAVTIKWDGYPALIFGRGSDGKFTIVDKHMFNRGIRNLNTLQDWIKHEQSRGDNARTGLMSVIQTIWRALEAECTEPGYYWGDLLFSQQLAPQGGLFKFRANPNGITYTVDATSPIGKLITGKIAGIAVHQYIAPNAASTDEAASLDGAIGNLRNSGNVAIVPSAMPVAPKVKIDRGLLNAAVSAERKHGATINAFMNGAPQARTAFESLFTIYINRKIVEGNLDNLVDGFYKFFEARTMTDKMRVKLTEYFKSNTDAVVALFSVWIAVYNLKQSVVEQLDQAAESSPVKGYLQDGTQTQEGFVSHGLKFVNRMGFARQNLAGRQSVNESSENRNVILVYGGGFQPFHRGHLSSYQQAKDAFPDADMYVAASNDIKTRPIPFVTKEFLAHEAGVSDPFVEVKAPINPREILAQYNPESDVFILVRSERDPVAYTKKDGSPGYFQPFESLDACESFAKHGYVFVTSKADFALNGETVYSGSQVRSMYAAEDDKGRAKIVAQLYPASKKQREIKSVLDQYLGEQVTEGDQPALSGIGVASPIPGTPDSMRPQPTEAEVEEHSREMADLKRFLKR
jgi:hypothetical protein